MLSLIYLELPARCFSCTIWVPPIRWGMLLGLPDVCCQCTVRVPSFLSEDVTFSLYFNFVFHFVFQLCISLLRVSWCTCQVPLIFLGSHVSLCCQVFPNVLSKHHQSVWGSYTCLLLVLDWAQLILHLSRWAAVAGLPSCLRMLFVLSEYFPCEVTLVAVSKYLLGSVSWFLLKGLLLSVKPVSSSSWLPSHFNFHLRLYKCWGLINKIPTGLGEK